MPLSYQEIKAIVDKLIGEGTRSQGSSLDTTTSPPLSNISGLIGEVRSFVAEKITSSSKKDNIRKIAYYFKSLGITREGTIGFLGNILGESQANPKAAESNPNIGGSGGIGIVQWTSSRRRKLENAATKNLNTLFSLNFQLQFLGNELKSSYPSVLKKLSTSKSIEESTIYVLEKFEVPGTYLNRKSNPQAYKATQNIRIGYAKSVIDIVDEIYST